MPSRSGIIQPNIDSNATPDPVFPYGEALLTGGLENARSMINGLGLVTRGFLWQLFDIWFDQTYYDSVTTSWANDNASITTNWTDSNTPITTIWISSQNGVFGEYTP